jgi:recombination protein RecR
MTREPAALQALIETLAKLPGIGPKSAGRIAHQLLQRDRETAERLAKAIDQALRRLSACDWCGALCEGQRCATCDDPQRDRSMLCVVESTADQLAIEQSRSYRGLYFVLQGRLSPLDGIGPQELRFERLLQRASEPQVQEVILATSFTSEGEATAHYLTEVMGARGIRISRLARGLPLGSELEYVDLGTIAHALLERRGQQPTSTRSSIDVVAES